MSGWISPVNIIRKVIPIYGVSWNKGANPALTRTDDAVGMTAAAGVGSQVVNNDFDGADIFCQIHDVIDTLGNVFVRIPKFYIRKTDSANLKTWQVSKYCYPGFYLPWCFWDFTNGKELPYYDHGKYKATKDASNRLESKPNLYPLINTNIVNFRTYAQNNNAGGLLGYQQLDIHAVDVLRTLFFIEFATLNSQAIMQGYTAGRYNATDTATEDTGPGNTIIVSNTTGSYYRVGQAISVGTSLGGNQVFYGRTIAQIDVDTPSAGSTTITFDGDPVSIATGNVLYNTGWKNGFSANIAASSGSLIANDGKYPCTYRGIESPFGDCWQYVDGVNINDLHAWVAKNAENYASNVFASPYEQLGYVNHNADGNVSAMGFDANYPFAEFSTAVSGNNTNYYCDNYWQAAGQRVARFGGYWGAGAFSGLSYWDLNSTSSGASVNCAGRLLKKPL